MTTATPTATATINGACTAVTVHLLADAQCPHGHRYTAGADSLTDTGTATAQAIQWAQDHANTCTQATAT